MVLFSGLSLPVIGVHQMNTSGSSSLLKGIGYIYIVPYGCPLCDLDVNLCMPH